MNVNDKRNFIINTIYAVIVCTIVFLVFKHIFPIVLPFILGLIFAGIICRLTKNLSHGKLIVRILLTILMFATMGIIIIFGVVRSFSVFYDWAMHLPDIYSEELLPGFVDFYHYMVVFIRGLNPNVAKALELMSESLTAILNDLFTFLSGTIVTFASNIIKSVPVMFFSIVVMIISTFFFVIDFEKIGIFLQNNLSDKWKARGERIKDYVKNTLLVIFRSYATIMFMTFCELSVLFFIFGIEKPVLIASLIAVFDIMPVLGTGGIMIPWMVISFITGNYIRGLALGFIYIFVTVVRNYAEPKIVGTQLGLHPIVALISMFIGLRLFGFIGMFGLPIGLSYVWKIHKDEKAVKTE